VSSFDDFDDDDDDADDAESAEELRQEAWENGKAVGYEKGFGCGCLFGIAILFVAIGFGWCNAPHF
jgi:hypothetical protein